MLHLKLIFGNIYKKKQKFLISKILFQNRSYGQVVFKILKTQVTEYNPLSLDISENEAKELSNYAPDVLKKILHK